MSKFPEIVLKKNEEKRILSGHPWVFRNETDKIPENIKDGSVVLVRAGSRKRIGIGYLNRASQITVRMLETARSGEYKPVKDLKNMIYNRAIKAVEKRRRIKNTDAYRLVFSEADRLPGLIADMYNGTVVVASSTLGMDNLKAFAVDAIIKAAKPYCVYEKSVSPSRHKEGLKSAEGVLFPRGAEIKPVIVTENGHRFFVDPLSGSKTGFYIDQRVNRKRFAAYVKKGMRVLDCFCATGAFSVYALNAGAAHVKAVDSSGDALDTAKRNMELNSLTGCEFILSDAFDFLRSEAKEKTRYDIVVLDPPPFAKSKAEKKGALTGHHDLHLSGLKLLKHGGHLFTFSCSHSVSGKDLQKSAELAAKETGCKIKVLEHLRQAPDHPVIKEIPETAYLKGLIIKKL